MALTPKQERFVAEYLVSLNATQAAIKAGYSERSAAETGYENLRKPQIAAEIARRSKKTADKYELSAELVVRSIVQELTFDPAKLYHDDGSLRQVTELDADTRAALTAVEFEQIGNADAPVYVRKLKWAQKQGAREQAMKHLGMFLEDNKQKRGVEALSDEALEQLIARKAKELGVTVH